MVRKCALASGVVLALLMPGVASAAACTKTWSTGVGSWGVAANWSPVGVPTSTDNVCITNPGTYTVTMSASDSGSVASLTLGAPSPSTGTQTLSIVGASDLSGTTTVHHTVLTLSSGGEIAPGGELILDATGNGTTNDGLTGGNAELDPGALTNAGRIVTQVEDPQWGTTLGAGTITNTAAIADVSGVLTTTANTINEGSIDVGSGATDTILGALFANAGAFTNGGHTTIEAQGSSPSAWAQAGPESGNPVALRGGATLVDSAGAGAFVFDLGGGGIVGTIPAGQSVDVRGELGDTTVSLGGSTSAPVVNHGDLVLEAPGTGTATGGTTHLTGGVLVNYGRLLSTVSDPSWSNYLAVALANQPGGIADVNSGVLHDRAAVANAGTAEVAPGAHWALDSGSSFVNESNGELEPDVNGPSSYGTVDLTGGRLTAGGTLAPFLVEHYVPAANTELRVIALSAGTFTGSFSKVLDGFTADYSHVSSTPAFVGAIYHRTSPPPPPPKPVLRVRSVSGGRGTVTVKLSCSGSGTCAGASIVVTAKHGHVVARGYARLKAGSSKTVTLKIKTKHKEKVSVTVSAGGQRDTFTNISVRAKT